LYGDDVEFEILDKEAAIISEILDRKTYLKRPNVSNITQVVFVISPNHPKPNLLSLDKELCYAEFLKINPIIVINKIDLDKEEAERLYSIYASSGYKVIKMQAEKKVRIR